MVSRCAARPHHTQSRHARLPPAARDWQRARNEADRMLVCQAIVHGLAVLTQDPRVVQYPRAGCGDTLPAGGGRRATRNA